MSALLLALVLQAPGLELDALTHPARKVREAAIARLAAGAVPTADLLAHLDHADSRVARAVVAVCRRRIAEEALPALARCGEHRDAARAEEAARAAVAIVLHHQLDLEDLDFSGMAALPARLQRAVDADVEAHLPRIRGFGHTKRTQNYRRFFAGGRYARKALERVARDRSRNELVREHALHGLAMLIGYKAENTLLELLDDAAPRVRIACCSLIFQFATTASIRELARRLDSVRLRQESETQWIVAAVERTRTLSDAGAKKLEGFVLEGVANRALGAAAALRRTRPEIFRRVVRSRVERQLAWGEKHPAAASEVALFQFRVGPLAKDLRARMRESSNPLVRAAALDDRDEALRAIAPEIAPEKPVGSREAMRVRIVHRLLILHEAPDRDRVRFAAAALNSQLASSRGYALRVLRGTAEAGLRPLRPRLGTLLEDEYESVRLGAAVLLGQERKAIAVALQALYDGGYGAARTVRRMLQKVRPEWPAVHPEGGAQSRRRQARSLRRLHKSEPRGKE